jgi:hypothetical protein
MIASDCDLASEMRLLSTLANADHGSSAADCLHGAQISRRDRLCRRCQRCLQNLDIRTQIRLPAAGTTAIGAMLIGDFLVDGSESGCGETHHRHGGKLGGTKDIAESRHDGPMHLCAGRFPVSIWLHDCSHPLSCSNQSGRARRPQCAQKSELCAQCRGPIRPDVTVIKLSPAFNNLNASKLGKKDLCVAATELSREGLSTIFGDASKSAPAFDVSANRPIARQLLRLGPARVRPERGGQARLPPEFVSIHRGSGGGLARAATGFAATIDPGRRSNLALPGAQAYDCHDNATSAAAFRTPSRPQLRS